VYILLIEYPTWKPHTFILTTHVRTYSYIAWRYLTPSRAQSHDRNQMSCRHVMSCRFSRWPLTWSDCSVGWLCPSIYEKNEATVCIGCQDYKDRYRTSVSLWLLVLAFQNLSLLPWKQ